MIQINTEDRMYLISQGIDISLPLCQNDLRGVVDIINDAVVDNIICHNDEPDAIGLKLQKISDRIRDENKNR